MSYLFEIIRDDKVVASGIFDTLEEGSLAPEFKDYFEPDSNLDDDEAAFEIDDLITEMVKYDYDTCTFHGKYGYVLKVTGQF